MFYFYTFRGYRSGALVKNRSINFYSSWNYQKRFFDVFGGIKIHLIIEVEFDGDPSAILGGLEPYLNLKHEMRNKKG